MWLKADRCPAGGRLRDTGGYHPGVNRALNRLVAVLGFGIVASQAGHLVVYQLEYGSAAWAVQSQGAHAYFPLFAKTGLGLGAAALLGALLLIAVIHLISGSPARRVVESPNYFQLLSLLFTIQIACFVIQETVESMAAGESPESAINLILLGAVGQLPVAILTALVLKWLATRFETALLVLRQTIATIEAPIVALGVLQPRLRTNVRPALVEACPHVYIKRGPPPNLRG